MSFSRLKGAWVILFRVVTQGWESRSHWGVMDSQHFHWMLNLAWIFSCSFFSLQPVMNLSIPDLRCWRRRRRRTLPEKRRSVQEPAVIAKSGDLDTLWGGGSKMTEKLKIQPETWSLPGSCISPCFTTTSYKSWKNGAAATKQTHRVKPAGKIGQEEINQSRILLVVITQKILQNYKHD